MGRKTRGDLGPALLGHCAVQGPTSKTTVLPGSENPVSPLLLGAGDREGLPLSLSARSSCPHLHLDHTFIITLAFPFHPALLSGISRLARYHFGTYSHPTRLVHRSLGPPTPPNSPPSSLCRTIWGMQEFPQPIPLSREKPQLRKALCDSQIQAQIGIKPRRYFQKPPASDWLPRVQLFVPQSLQLARLFSKASGGFSP